MRELVAVDLGGTHARFAVAAVRAGEVAALGPETVLKCADFESLEAAWAAFAAGLGRPAPRAAAVAVAAPVGGAELKLTNSPWVLRPKAIQARLGLEALTLVNDFGAVAHAVAKLGPEHLTPLCGPDRPLPREGVISVLGPGTGLGVAQLLRRDGHDHVIETEGGHVGFAPLDALEDALLQRLRARYGRVSAERVVCGAGLAAIYETLAAVEGRPAKIQDDKALWSAGLDGRDPLADEAVEWFCRCLGAAAGDFALAHGAVGVAIAGGLGLRLAGRLPGSGFAERFFAKGRFAARMAALPVKVVTHPQPGLFGAAAAFAEEHAWAAGRQPPASERGGA
jgi:glucokinase